VGQCCGRCCWRCHRKHARLPVRSVSCCPPTSCSHILIPPRIKTRLQVQIRRSPTSGGPNPADHEHYDGALDAIRKVIAHEGVSGLYAGMAGSLLGVASTNFAYFYWYTVVRSLYMSRRTLQTSPGTAVELSLGAVAGALAQLFTIPVAVVTTRQQTMSKHERKGMIATGMDVINGEDGWTGLWRGLRASLVLVINPSITYGAYQRLREVLYPGKKTLKPWEAFRASYQAMIQSNMLIDHSPRINVKNASHYCYTAADRCESRSPIEATTRKKRQTIQKLHRGHAIYHTTRGSHGAFQGHWTPDPKGTSCARLPDDDQGEV
jgi:hypothetical protein